VLDAPTGAFPAAPAELAIGANPIGDPACAPLFTGIISMSRQSP
jgi:hypothetical protein